jgi:hypothetical protein
VLAGRGFGKTRTGAELVSQWIKRYPLVNLIGATADDARDIMIEGESGILAICPKDERPEYKKSARKLLWPNDAKSLIFTADEPDSRSGRVTISTSPGCRAPITRRGCARSVLAPLATSRNTFLHPALVSWRTCASTLGPSVDTLA